jgi:DNA-binding transcriptional MerR regulator
MSEEEARNFSEFMQVSVANPAAGELYNIQVAAEYSAIDPEGIRSYCRQGFITAVEYRDGEPLFDEDGIYWLRRLQNLRSEMHLDGRALRVVLDLMREVESLRQALRAR